jgi:serine/threonine protein phosphatase PrpC
MQNFLQQAGLGAVFSSDQQDENRGLSQRPSLLESVQEAVGLGNQHGIPNQGPNSKTRACNGSRDDLGLWWGVADMQGWRKTMEDAFVASGHFPQGSQGWEDTGIFGVFDGHGGSQVADLCAAELPRAIARGRVSKPKDTMRSSFLAVDRNLGRANLDHVGCTAVVSLIDKQKICVANAGDSRAVLSRNGRAFALSRDHKPNLPAEMERIRNAGGHVSEHHVGTNKLYRVNRDLAVSRAMGDFRLKRNPKLGEESQLVSCVPEIQFCIRQPEDEFMIIACDGVWDVLSSQEAVDRVGSYLPQIRAGELQPSDVVRNILNECLASDPADLVGTDNMTMILVVFRKSANGNRHEKRAGPNNTTMVPSCVNRLREAWQPEPRNAKALHEKKMHEDLVVGHKVAILRSTGKWTNGEITAVDREHKQVCVTTQGVAKAIPFANVKDNIRVLTS